MSGRSSRSTFTFTKCSFIIFAISSLPISELPYEYEDILLKGLPLHHMAPVAGRIADRQQDWLATRSCSLEGILAPRVPVYRVRLVLLQIRRALPSQSVHISGYTRHGEALEEGLREAKAHPRREASANPPKRNLYVTGGKPNPNQNKLLQGAPILPALSPTTISVILLFISGYKSGTPGG